MLQYVFCTTSSAVLDDPGGVSNKPELRGEPLRCPSILNEARCHLPRDPRDDSSLEAAVLVLKCSTRRRT